MKAPRKWKEYLALFVYFQREIQGCSKSFVPLSIGIMLIQAVRPFLFAYLPSLLIDELVGQRRLTFIVAYVMAVTVGAGCLNLLIQELQKRRNVQCVKVNRKMEMNVSIAMADVPYARLEDENFLNFRQTYLNGLNRSSPIAYVMERAFDTGACLLQLVWYFFLLIYLLMTDRNLISTGIPLVDFLVSNTWIWLLFIAGISIFSSWLKMHADNMYTKMVEEFAPTDRAYAYYQKIVKDQTCAKDIRLFRFYPLLLTYMDDYRRKAWKLEVRLANATLRYSAPAELCLKVQALLIYILATLKVFVKTITYGQFYLYTSVIGNVVNTLSDMLDCIAGIRYAFGFHYAYRALVEDEGEEGTGNIPLGKFESMEFEDVWFKYPGSDVWILKGFSCKINTGQRISIVGMNGAGKTTLIKLMHRFYQPDRGRILLNGIDINSYSYDEYLCLFSTVFQDVHYWAYSAGENISSSVEPDRGLGNELLEKVGLKKMFAGHKGLDTELTRYFSEDGVILSGGEAQKLAIARAFYKNAPVYVFDEPTAALDPLAEKEIVDCFDEFTRDRTVIYISHRMASCRNSDRILVMDCGCLAECGTHKELLNARGIYAQLWFAQAQWYMPEMCDRGTS